MTAFEEMGVIPEISKAITRLGWELPTEIQAEAIPLILGGGDILMTAETGSGKTAAFCIPLLQIVAESLLNVGKVNERDSSENNYCGWNPSDKERDFIINGNESCAVGNRWAGSRSTFSTTRTGYFEVKVENDGLCRIGWSTKDAGLCLGLDRFGYGYGSTAKKSNNRQFITYGEEFGIHDVVGSFIDLNAGVIRFTKNGKDLGLGFEIPHKLRSLPFFAAMTLKGCKVSTNFGKGGFLASFPSDMKNSGTLSFSDSPKRSSKSPISFIIEPSRELAVQTFKQLNDLKPYLTDIDCLLLTGGTSVETQIGGLRTGENHIVVCTVGKLKEFIDSDWIDPKDCRYLILDEADSLISGNDCAFITQTFLTDKRDRLQVVVCSATLHNVAIRRFAQQRMPFATFVDLKGEDSVPDTVHHIVCLVDPDTDGDWRQLSSPIRTDQVHQNETSRDISRTSDLLVVDERSQAIKLLKGEYLVRTIQRLNIDRAIIFCRTKLDCDNLHSHFQKIYKSSLEKARMFSSLPFHSGQSQRHENLSSFKNGCVNFLISTDVACRGIHINQLPFVINMTLPDDPANYIHRIGRTGRVERMGLAVSLVAKYPEKVWYHSNCRGGRGAPCYNTNLVSNGGCCIWYNEFELLREIEENLKCSVETVACTPNMTVPVFEYEGKVVYGQKRRREDTVGGLADVVDPSDLLKLESTAQRSFIRINEIVSSLK